eukprot:489842-Pleurochrysis_carterae.AAC.2
MSERARAGEGRVGERAQAGEGESERAREVERESERAREGAAPRLRPSVSCETRRVHSCPEKMARIGDDAAVT